MIIKKDNMEDKNSQVFDSLLGKGLSKLQVEKLKEKGFVNVSSNKTYKTVSRIIFDNIFTYFNLIFFALGLCLFLVGSYKDMLFLFVIFLNVFIGIFQQIRSKIKIDRLNLISSLKSVVLRDGRKETILNSEVVLGDIIFFKAGDQINIDAVLLDGSLQVDESLLTGEPDAIFKDKNSKLLSGSFVLSGECAAKVEKVGDNCYACRLAREAKKNVKQNKSEMMSSLNSIIKVIGFAIIPFGLVLFLKQIFIMHMEYSESVKVTVAALVGMIPEGLYLLTSVALVVSVLKLVDSKVLVHDMSCIETLARVDVLCIDKTGTITEPKMKVTGVESLTQNIDKNQLYDILNDIVFAMSADNETAKALKTYFKSKTKWEAKKIHPFLSATKWFGVDFKDSKGTYILGAPEFILKKENVKIKSKIDDNMAQGKRVLLVAKLEGEILNFNLFGDIKPLALILIENPIRKGVFKTLNFFQDEGVKVKVLSGDNPYSVKTICKKAKIKNVEKYIDVSMIKTEKELAEAVFKYDIFGRVTPEQKKKIVDILQREKKHTVAMVGDGVNDVLALRSSDVGVAMASGSDAASQAAEIVLLNSDFNFMPKIVMEGRRVINNIQRFASLFLVKNIFSFCFAFLALFLNLMFPINPFQFTLISAITIGIPSFFLTMEPSTAIVKGSFIENVMKKALPGGLCNLIIILFVQIISRLLHFEVFEISSISAILLGIGGLLVLIEVCMPINKIKFLVILVMSGLMGFCIFFVKEFCNIYIFSTTTFLVLIGLCFLIRPLFNFLIFLCTKQK